MGALRTCRVLAAAYGVELRVVAREAEDGFGEVVPRAHAFIGEVVEPCFIELSTLNVPTMKRARSSAEVGVPTWSKTTRISGRSLPRRSMVFMKFAP